MTKLFKLIRLVVVVASWGAAAWRLYSRFRPEPTTPTSPSAFNGRVPDASATPNSTGPVEPALIGT